MMPSDVVAQVHRLTQQANAKKNIMFTNTLNEDISVLYAATEHSENDVDPVQANDKLTGVDGED